MRKLLQKLNGWQRIGVILTVVWWIGFVAHFLTEKSDSAMTLAKSVLHSCIDRKTPGVDCYAQFPRNYSGYMEMDVSNWLVLILGPIAIAAIAWLAVYCVIWIVRWVGIGFRAKPP